ncbi:MAG TPA: ADP-ribosylglycohydrolase family protein [Clostridiaceae bacterium]|jgi:ADP-ribosylglycohydrolase|nr:ADP-ribosylglycohydrolase family protein [Clostridiaceae bacterium]
MFGAIIGDIIGSPYERPANNIRTKDFPLFSERSRFTDDTVMTLAVADAFFEIGYSTEELSIRETLIRSMQKFGRRHPNTGYGKHFMKWLTSPWPQPYGSYGNGSAMRVSSVGWLFHDLAKVRQMARLSADVSHNHPEGIKGAEAVASAIFLARTGSSKEEIREYIEVRFKYDLSRTIDDIRPTYTYHLSCMETVPEAITAFLEGEDFEDVLRTAVSLGGDSDTITAIAGSIAEAYYGVPDLLKNECFDYLTDDLIAVLQSFEQAIS